MSVVMISCPLCCQPGFNTLESLRDNLIGAASRPITCPVCQDVSHGIDKFTIHIFGHFLRQAIHQPVQSCPQIVQSCPQSIQSCPQIVQSCPQIVQPFIQSPESCQPLSNDIYTTSQNQSQDVLQNTEDSFRNMQNNNNSIRSIRKNPKPLKIPLQCDNKVKVDISYDKWRCVNVASEGVNKVETCRNANVEKITSNVEMSFENIAILESCGLKQDALGLVSETRPEKDGAMSEQSQHEMLTGVVPSQSQTECRESEAQVVVTLDETRCNETQHELGRSLDPTSTNITTQHELRCSLCNFSFPDSHILALHTQLVHDARTSLGDSDQRKPFGCYLCAKEFKMRGSLMVHLRVAHGGMKEREGNCEADADVRQFVCATCGKSFKKEQHLSQHAKTHEGKQWSCETCQKMFTTKYFLKKHRRLHTGEMPYRCSVCDKCFTFQQSMHKHALYHRDEKPHECPDCNRTFKELSTLHNHRRIHTGEKPFSCETCGKCFRQRVSYLVHRRIHTGVMPYKCTACGKSFRYKVSERTHKCPSQPQGTIVRQAGELVQKLQQRAALVSATNTTGEPAASRITDQQLLNSNQFIIVLDDSTQPSRSVYVTQPDMIGCSDVSHIDKPGLGLTSDLFAMVDNLSSPADRLKNLSISSPDSNDGQATVERSSETLHTINEESLKQLLYGSPL